jgi:hypothetical protein
MSDGGYLVPPEMVRETLDAMRPSPENVARWHREALERRQREREQPLPVKARRWLRSARFAGRRRWHLTREAFALLVAPWLERED